MRSVAIPILALSALAFLSAGCGDRGTAPAPASPDEVVLNVPAMS